MHRTAYVNCENFYKKYCENNFNKNSIVVDFGSLDVNGTLKPIFQNHKYVGLDMEAGNNVDVVCVGNNVPLEDCYADAIVSSSCFEHDICFWESFLEMCRIIKPGGHIYINAPSGAAYHAWPVDCWRFYLDSWPALETYGQRKGYNIKLLEKYIDESYGDKDSVGIFIKL